jgi:hypothetical protein
MTRSAQICFSPSNAKELRSLPAKVQKLNLRQIAEDLRDEHLSNLPDTLEYLDLTGCRYLNKLNGLVNKVHLRRVDCLLCSGLTQKSVSDFYKALPDTKLDLWGCWQMRSTNKDIREMYNKVFTDYLHIEPNKIKLTNQVIP